MVQFILLDRDSQHSCTKLYMALLCLEVVHEIAIVDSQDFGNYFFCAAYLNTGSVSANDSASVDGLVAPSLWVTPLVLDFGHVGVDDTGGPLTITIHNTGDDTLTNFAGGGVASPFSGAQNCAGGVPPGGSCQYFFTFSPTEVGNFTTTSNSSTNAGPFTIELRGEGVGPGL